MITQTKEYGGYLPFECGDGNEYYCGEDVIALNSARNALVYAIRDGNYSKVYIPFYMCESIRHTLKRYSIEYSVYHIDCDYMPVGVHMKTTECLFYPNYYGLFSRRKMLDIVERYGNVILDCTQAFFMEPIREVYNIYSCRKFIGVPDGAYVVKAGICHVSYPRDHSASRVTHLFGSIELGTNGAYSESILSEIEIENSEIMEMSETTHALLKSVDYNKIQLRRKHNYDTLQKYLRENSIPQSIRSSDCVPMIYPFFSLKSGVRERLIQNHIYVPFWWKYLLNDPEISLFEQTIVEGIMPLPVDQRYTTKDMDELAIIVQRLI